eukprot:gene5879-5783_t
MLMKPKDGIMAFLDEQSSLGSGSDEAFFGAVTAKYEKAPFFDRKPQDQNKFIVRHYAADVRYTVDGMLEKNRDTLKDALKLLLRTSC